MSDERPLNKMLREARIEPANPGVTLPQAEQAEALLAIEKLERKAIYWQRQAEQAREDLEDFRLRTKEAEAELGEARKLVELFGELHRPRTPAQRRRHAEDERGWNMMLHGAVNAALTLYPREVNVCEVCDGEGFIACDCGDPEHACGGGEEVECGACDGEGEG